MEKEKQPRVGAGFLPILVLITIVVFLVTGCGSEQSTETSTAGGVDAGVAFIKQQETGNPDEIDNMLKTIREEEMKRERDERLRQLAEGEISVWSLFEDYAIVGDSRAADFYADGFLPAERVLAEIGQSLSYVDSVKDELKHLNPSHIFLTFSINDVENHPDDFDGYREDFVNAIETIRSVCPTSTIYINSSIEATEIGIADSPVLRYIPEYNEVLKEVCKELSCIYIDNDNIYRDHVDLYDADGVHFIPDAYPYWAANMIMAMYDAQSTGVGTEASVPEPETDEAADETENDGGN